MGLFSSKPEESVNPASTNIPISELEVKNIPTGPLTRLQKKQLRQKVIDARAKIDNEMKDLDNRCGRVKMSNQPCTFQDRKRFGELRNAYDKTYRQVSNLNERTITNKNVIHPELAEKYKELQQLIADKEKKEAIYSNANRKISPRMRPYSEELKKMWSEYTTAKEKANSYQTEYDKLQNEYNERQLKGNTTTTSNNKNTTPTASNVKTPTSNGGKRKTKRAKRAKTRK